jgi:phage-related protein
MILLNLAFAANPIGATVVAIAALIAGLVLAYNKVGWFHDLVDAAFSGIVAAFEWVRDIALEVFDWLSEHWPLILIILTGPFGLFITAIIRYRDEIIDAVKAVIDWVRDHWELLLVILTGPFGLALVAILRFKDDVIGAVMAAIDFVREHWLLILEILTGPFGAALLVITTFWDDIKNGARDAVEFVVGKFEWLVDKIEDIVSDVQHAIGLVVDAIKAPMNAVIGAWNDLAFTVPEIDTHIPGVGRIGGQTINFPDIDRLASGGLVTSPTLAWVGEAGPEAVIPLDQMDRWGRGQSYVLNMYPRRADPADVAFAFRRLEIAATGR